VETLNVEVTAKETGGYGGGGDASEGEDATGG